MKSVILIVVMVLSMIAQTAQAIRIRVDHKLIYHAKTSTTPAYTVLRITLSRFTSSRDIIDTYINGGVNINGVWYPNNHHDNGPARAYTYTGTQAIGDVQWQSCTGCGSSGGGGGGKLKDPDGSDLVTYDYYYHNGQMIAEYIYDSNDNLIDATIYSGGVKVYSYGIATQPQQTIVVPMGPTEDKGTYTVVTTDINNDGVVVLQKYSIGIPFGHIVASYEKLGTYGFWKAIGTTNQVSTGLTSGSSSNFVTVPDDTGLDNKDH